MLPTLMIIMLGIGIFLVIAAGFKMKNADSGIVMDSTELDLAFTKLEKSINEADMAMNEFDDLSKSVFKEIDIKYEELLYLYNLIESKKKETYDELGKTFHEKQNVESIKSDLNKTVKKRSTESRVINKFNKQQQVLDYHKKGYTESEIAKTLDIGQGEVKFMLELSKGK